MSNANNENRKTVSQWLQSRFENLIDEIFAAVLTTFIVWLLFFIFTQWPLIATSPFLYFAIGLAIFAIILVYRYRYNLLRLFMLRKLRPEYPLITGVPIASPENFYGRRDQCREFFDLIKGPQAMSMSILGVRRSGKTSFLNFVRHPRTLAKYYIDRSKYIFVLLDLEDGRFGSPESFYTQAITSIYAEMSRLPRILSVPARSADAMYDLRDLISALNRNDIRLIFLLDEFEYLVQRKQFTEDFFLNLRSLVVEGNVSWVTSSHRSLDRLLSTIGVSAGSPFFNIFHVPSIFLGALENDSCDALIRKPLLVEEMHSTEDAVNFIKTLAGRLPYWIQIATESYWTYSRNVRERNQSALEQNVSAAFDSSMVAQFEHYWKSFDVDERNVLYNVATKRRARKSRDTLGDNNHLRNLERYGILEQVGEGFSVSSSSFARWISNRKGTSKKTRSAKI